MSVFRFFSILAVTAALASPLAAGAQTPPPPAPASPASPPAPGPHRHRHHESFNRALRAVNLTPAQQQQIAALRDQERKANLNADPATKKANAAKMREQIRALLTPDQQTQLSAAMHRAPEPPMNGAPAQPNPAPSPGSN